MAVYEFRCRKSGHDFEVLRPMSEWGKPAKCPKCGSSGERLISDFASNQESAMQVPTGKVLREPPAKPLQPASRAPQPKSRAAKKPQATKTTLRRAHGKAKMATRR